MSVTSKSHQLALLWRRLLCAFGRHDLQIQFTVPSRQVIAEQLSCVTCGDCGGRWVTCLQVKGSSMIPFWQLYSAQDEVDMQAQNEERGTA